MDSILTVKFNRKLLALENKLVNLNGCVIEQFR